MLIGFDVTLYRATIKMLTIIPPQQYSLMKVFIASAKWISFLTPANWFLRSLKISDVRIYWPRLAKLDGAF